MIGYNNDDILVHDIYLYLNKLEERIEQLVHRVGYRIPQHRKVPGNPRIIFQRFSTELCM